MATSEVSDPTLPSATLVAPEESFRDDLRWVVPVWVVVLVFTALTVVRSVQVGIPLRDPHGDILLTRVAISLGLFVLYGLLDALVRTRRLRMPLRRTWSVAHARWTAPATRARADGAGGLPRDVLLLPQPEELGRLQPPARLDAARLGPLAVLRPQPGRAAARRARPGTVRAWVLAYWYETFGTLVLFAVVAPVVFVRDIREGWVAMVAGVWIWILGTATYYLIPTLGPFDSAPQEFAGLPHMMIQDTQARYMGQRAHMLADPQAHDAFAQVSAFASLHVGVTAVIWLMARYYGYRRLSWALGVFLAGTVVATIYLGWHFFVDDVAGLAIAYLAVWLGKRMVYPRGRPTSSPVQVDTAPSAE